MNDEEWDEHRRRGYTDYFAGQRHGPEYRGPGDGWSDRAACKGAPAGTFYPKVPESGGRPGLALVMSYCGQCPVGGECLAWAIRTEEFGYWGGTSPDERARLRQVLGIEFVYVTPYRARVQRESRRST
ncbi:MAG TPA: WhiB family transcriptional regulator [Acidimicrobiales bacterium]|nr:WhiB family transcriptional regulator [Acidimicrobiales bacterium]